MNICCTVNEKFLKPLKVLLMSLAHTQEDVINLYLINKELYEKELKEIESFCKALNINFYVIPFPQNIYEKIKESSKSKIDGYWNNFYSLEVYYRLFIPKLLPNFLHRCLYLDTDIVVTKSIYTYYYQNLYEYSAVAVPDSVSYIDSDFNREWYPKHRRDLGLKSEDTLSYFNAGVLLLNLDKLRDDKRFKEENIYKCIREKDFGCHDQDILNYLLEEDVLICKNKAYNCPILYTENSVVQESSVLHYTTQAKPWSTEENYDQVIKLSYYKNYEKLVDLIDNLIKKK